MKKHIAILTVFIFACLANCTAQGQKPKIATYTNMDLYFFGKAMIMKDPYNLNNISKKGNDLYLVGSTILEKDESVLSEIKAQDFFYLAVSLNKKDSVPLSKIIDKDLQLFGWTLLTSNESYLDKITSVDLSNLAKAILRDDLNFLESLNY
ncbi:MAG: hypothetical protein HXX09_09315 [Bacteroidetes bacterium]|nr:hypothetical protein [Bacteroidota bacterium]